MPEKLKGVIRCTVLLLLYTLNAYGFAAKSKLKQQWKNLAGIISVLFLAFLIMFPENSQCKLSEAFLNQYK